MTSIVDLKKKKKLSVLIWSYVKKYIIGCPTLAETTAIIIGNQAFISELAHSSSEDCFNETNLGVSQTLTAGLRSCSSISINSDQTLSGPLQNLHLGGLAAVLDASPV